jgi:hypothetical protein
VDTHTRHSIHALCHFAAQYFRPQGHRLRKRRAAPNGLPPTAQVIQCIEGYRWHGYGRDTPIALSTLLLATSAVCGVYCGDHSTPR